MKGVFKMLLGLLILCSCSDSECMTNQMELIEEQDIRIENEMVMENEQFCENEGMEYRTRITELAGLFSSKIKNLRYCSDEVNEVLVPNQNIKSVTFPVTVLIIGLFYPISIIIFLWGLGEFVFGIIRSGRCIKK